MPNLTRILSALGIAACAISTASAKVERVVDKTFQVQPGVHLKVGSMVGEIRVESSADNVVRVIAKEHIRASSDADADLLLQKLDLVIESTGSGIVATAKYEDDHSFHFGDWPPVVVDFVVTVPQTASVDLGTSGGDISIGDIAGPVKARTSGGAVRMGKIASDIDASTSGGDVALDSGGGKVYLSTSGGDIKVGRVLGTADLRTSGGTIRIDGVSGQLYADTSGGNVRATFDGPLKGDCTLATSGGEVKATVDRNIGFHLSASTSGGDVSADGLTITIEHGGVGKSSLSGDVNGGGPLLKLRSSGGDITVATQSARS
jgi:Putative adhesin